MTQPQTQSLNIGCPCGEDELYPEGDPDKTGTYRFLKCGGSANACGRTYLAADVNRIKAMKDNRRKNAEIRACLLEDKRRGQKGGGSRSKSVKDDKLGFTRLERPRDEAVEWSRVENVAGPKTTVIHHGVEGVTSDEVREAIVEVLQEPIEAVVVKPRKRKRAAPVEGYEFCAQCGQHLAAAEGEAKVCLECAEGGQL